MRFHVPNWVTLCLISWLLSGCELMFQAGPGLTTGRDDYLKSIKPHLQYYEKPGWAPETRRQDSAECGAPPNEYIQFGSNAIKAAQRPGETDRQTENRLSQEWHACMVQKGYRDVRAVTR